MLQAICYDFIIINPNYIWTLVLTFFCKQSLTPTTKSAILKMHKKDYFCHEIYDYQVFLHMANFTSDKIKVDEQYKPIFSFLYD